MWCYNVTRALIWCYNASLDGVGGGFRGQMAKQGSKQGLHSFISAPRALSLAPPLILIYFRKSFFQTGAKTTITILLAQLHFPLAPPSYLILIYLRKSCIETGLARLVCSLNWVNFIHIGPLIVDFHYILSATFRFEFAIQPCQCSGGHLLVSVELSQS